MRLTDCANAEQLLRIIQSIPSKKAEPFKQWLALVGKERLDEMADPELALQRGVAYYQSKGIQMHGLHSAYVPLRCAKNLQTNGNVPVFPVTKIMPH